MNINVITGIIAVIIFGISAFLSVLGIISSNNIFVVFGIITLIVGWIIAYVGDKFKSQKD